MTTNGLEAFGFTPPVNFQELQRLSVLGGRYGTPDIGGVYAVYRPRTVVDDTSEVVYIGKGSLGRVRARGDRRGLWHRMRQYRNATYAGGSSHVGGKLLKDLPDKADLLIQAIGVRGGHESCLEYFLVDTFRSDYQRLPLANIISPPRPTNCCLTLEEAAEYRFMPIADAK